MTEREIELGATGRFPRGKLNNSDQGEIRMAITNDKGKVMMDFGKPIAWVGLDPVHARILASLLNDHAANAAEYLSRKNDD